MKSQDPLDAILLFLRIVVSNLKNVAEFHILFVANLKNKKAFDYPFAKG